MKRKNFEIKIIYAIVLTIFLVFLIEEVAAPGAAIVFHNKIILPSVTKGEVK